jgi:diketogulonate reductase-like aldo/keto reductase
MSRTRSVQGVLVPSFFYGTAWKEERTEALVAQALFVGFRAIDTANQRKHYFEAGVGAAIARFLEEGHARDELFLQTKYTHPRGQDSRLPYDLKAPNAARVRQSFQSSLDHLHTNYLDSYVLHGPSYADTLADADWEVWGAMEGLHAEGKTKLLGISNVSADQLSVLVRGAKVKPAFVQNRCYASAGWDADVRAICDANQVAYQGFSLLTANRRELARPGFSKAAQRHQKSNEQIAFRLALQLGMLPLTGSSDASHLQQDLAVFDFELTKVEVTELMR